MKYRCLGSLNDNPPLILAGSCLPCRLHSFSPRCFAVEVISRCVLKSISGSTLISYFCLGIRILFRFSPSWRDRGMYSSSISYFFLGIWGSIRMEQVLCGPCLDSMPSINLINHFIDVLVRILNVSRRDIISYRHEIGCSCLWITGDFNRVSEFSQCHDLLQCCQSHEAHPQ
jgi:hypothetical protein